MVGHAMYAYYIIKSEKFWNKFIRMNESHASALALKSLRKQKQYRIPEHSLEASSINTLHA